MDAQARTRVPNAYLGQRDSLAVTASPGGDPLPGFTVESVHRRVHVNGRGVHLTDTEFRLLVILLQHRGTVLRREQAIDAVWGPGFRGCRRTLDVYVSRLRAKLRETVRLEAKRGVGYRLRGNDAEAAA